MNTLKLYLSKLSAEEKEAFASKCGTTINYIRKVLSSESLFFGPIIARKMEVNSGGEVSRKNLRPHDWHEHWPELAEKRSGTND